MAVDTLAADLERLETEQERIFLWRLATLRRAGYGERYAFKLALRTEVDLHVAVSLLARGCPERTAVRILL
jgi:hypothetical protein